MYLTPEQNILFSLLKTSLWHDKDREALLSIPSEADWGELFTLAARQGVLGVSLDGLAQVEKRSGLSKNDQIPGLSKELLIRWELSVKKMEARNKRQKEVIKELVALFRENGIEMLLLKGIGLGMNYPQPSHRECGDIDIYLFGDYEKGNKVIENLGIEVDKEGAKHSKFYFKGVPVENHKTLLNVEYSKTDKNLEQHLLRVLDEQGFDSIMIDDVSVRVPTPDFIATFLTRHDITHFLASGLVMRHFCDLALFFEKNGDRIDFVRFEKLMREVGQYDFFCSFLAIGQEYLGMPEESFPGISINHQKVTVLTNRVLEDSLYNKYRSIDKKKLETMWVPRRKLLGLKHFLASKWKYDSIDRWLFYKIFIQRIYLTFL